MRLTGRHRQRTGPAYVFAPWTATRRWIARARASAGDLEPAEGAGEPGRRRRAGRHPHRRGQGLALASLVPVGRQRPVGPLRPRHEGGGTLASVLEVLNATNTRGYAALGHRFQGPAASILQGFAKTPPEEAGSILSTARACLSAWLDERVAAGPPPKASNQLDLDLAAGPMARRSIWSRRRRRRSAAAPSSPRCSAACSGAPPSGPGDQGGALSPRLLLALDEAANFARVPRLASYVSTGPGQGIQSLLCFHDLAQLEAGYGQEQARTVWNNCRARLLPRPGRPQDAAALLRRDRQPDGALEVIVVERPRPALEQRGADWPAALLA